jgi:16S rRNA processing protein RimM
MAAEDLILVGRIARPHGIKGQVVVNPDTDFLEQRYQVGATLLVGGPPPVPRKIVTARFQQGRPIIGFEGVESMDDAELLAGLELRLPADALGELPERTFYHHDLVGCEVSDPSGMVLGRVASVEGPMERSRLVIAGARGEIQIPLNELFCPSIDTATRRIVVDPPPGLLELNETPRLP